MSACFRVVLLVSGHVAEYFPGGASRLEVELEKPASVSAILAGLGVSEGLVMSVLAGGSRKPLSYVPEDGEELTLIGPPAGG
jgi:hypothetical protein